VHGRCLSDRRPNRSPRSRIARSQTTVRPGHQAALRRLRRVPQGQWRPSQQAGARVGVTPQMGWQNPGQSGKWTRLTRNLLDISDGDLSTNCRRTFAREVSR